MTKNDRLISKVARLRESLYAALGRSTVLAGEAIAKGDEFTRSTCESRVAAPLKDAIEALRDLDKDILSRKATP